MARKVEAKPSKRSLEEIAKEAPSATQAKVLAIREGYTERRARDCAQTWKAQHASPSTRTSGHASVHALVALAVVSILAALIGCADYKGGQYNDIKDDLNSGGDMGRLLRGKDKPAAKGPSVPKPAPQQAPVIQFFGVDGRPGFWNDGALGLSSGSRHIFVSSEQPGLKGMLGTMAVTVSGIQNGKPIGISPVANLDGWHDRIFTNAEIPDSVRDIKAVKIDANGVVVAEADKTYTVRFEGDNFFTGDSEQLEGVPAGVGSIYFDRFNSATSTLSIRTAGRKVLLIGSSDDGKPHVLGNEDVNGWSSLVLTDLSGNPVTAGKYAALLLALDAGDVVKDLLDVSKAKFAADIPVTGSSAKKRGIAFFVDKGIVYLNPTAADAIAIPALASLTTFPTKALVPVGDTFTFNDVLGVFAGGYRTSVRNSTTITGSSSLTGVASVVSALSRKGESAGTANQTVQIGTITSAPATELTVFESFLELSASHSMIVSGGKTEIRVILHKRGEEPRDVSKDPATVFAVDKPASLTMAGNVGTGGSQGNPIVTVTAEGATLTITIQVQPKPRLIEARLPKTTFVSGEEFTPELIVIAEGAFVPENKASSARWTSSSSAVAQTVAEGGKTVTQSGGGKAKLTASYLGLTVETQEFTVTPVAPLPKVTSIVPASLSVSFKNTDAAQMVGVTVGKSNGQTSQPATGVTVKSFPDYVTVTMDTSDATSIKVKIEAKANRSGSGGNVVLTHADGVDSQPIAVTLLSVLASIGQPSNLTLQVGTTSQMAALTGTQNNSANAGGATSAALGFDKVMFGSSNSTIASASATGLVTAGATAGTATITVTSTDVPSVTKTFTVTTTLPQGGSLGDAFTSISPTYRAQVLANNGDGTSRVRHYLATARLPGLKDKPKAMMTRPDRGFQFTIVTLSATETASDGSTWYYWDTLDTITTGERFLLNLFNGDSVATATNWAVISGSGFYNFTDSNANGVRDGAEPDALTPIVNAQANTVTKGSM